MESLVLDVAAELDDLSPLAPVHYLFRYNNSVQIPEFLFDESKGYTVYIGEHDGFLYLNINRVWYKITKEGFILSYPSLNELQTELRALNRNNIIIEQSDYNPYFLQLQFTYL